MSKKAYLFIIVFSIVILTGCGLIGSVDSEEENITPVPTLQPLPEVVPSQDQDEDNPDSTESASTESEPGEDNEEDEVEESSDDQSAIPSGDGGREILIGRRDFTEQDLLAEITMLALNQSGYESRVVDPRNNIDAIYDDLSNGQIDISWEYIGTSLVDHHSVPLDQVPRDPEQALDQVQQLDAPNGLTWLTPSSINNTYTLMIRQGTIAEGLATYEDLANYMNENNIKLSLCVEGAFMTRDDGVDPLQAFYGFDFEVLTVSYDFLYEELKAGTCNVAEGYSTDGRSYFYDFVTLEDSRQFFPPYVAAPLVHNSLLSEFPEIETLMAQIASKLNNETITALNTLVDLGPDFIADSGDELSVADVAQRFLEVECIIEDCPQIAVGSRDFTEQYLLAEITIQLLESRGVEVIDKTNFDNIQAIYDAFDADELDISWDYTGTALTQIHNVPSEDVPSNLNTAFDFASQFDREKGLIWLTSSSFNDTYTLMVNPFAGSVDDTIQSIDDLATYMNNNGSPLNICVEENFAQRTDGLGPLQEVYQFQFKEENIIIIPYDDLYEMLREGQCDVAEGFSTDGRILAYGFRNLIDSRGFFPAYNAAPIVRQEILDEYPWLNDSFAQIGPLLTDAEMTLLNARVDIGPDNIRNSGDEETVEAVARDFLESNCITVECVPADVADESQLLPSTNASCTNILTNGDFESESDWRLPITAVSGSYSNSQVHNGNWALLLGVTNREKIGGYSTANYQIFIPEDASSARLTYWFYPISSDIIGGDSQGMLIYDKDISVIFERVMWNISNDQQWQSIAIDLSNYIGQEITLHFVVVNDSDGAPSTMFVDDVLLEICDG